MVYFSAFAPCFTCCCDALCITGQNGEPTETDCRIPGGAQNDLAIGTAILNRREWLRGFSGLCGVLSLPVGSTLLVATSMASLEDWVSCISSDAPHDALILAQLGKTYLTAHPHEAGCESLARLLVPEGWTAGTLAGVSESVRRDWTNHDVTTVEGWVLARTEARLCGLIFKMAAVAA
ncbi:MAG TPA: hypothetical protein VMF03_19965 [Steroidobacteraceae bacterium]|nr:hypothetical protein [Steroidobacteraceae bacterium]